MKNIFRTIKKIKVITNEPMKKHTSFRIGGKVLYFVIVYNENALIKVMSIIKKHNLNYLIIGEGTNILFSDARFNGVVIKLMGRFRKIENDKNKFICGAGAPISKLIKKALARNYGGIEFLAGIPGSIGGAVKGNAGAFGHSISEVIDNITVLNQRLIKMKIPKEKIFFEYRRSNIPEKMIILSVELQLKKSNKKVISRKINKLLKMRWSKQPAGYSAGSFFKNPLPFSAGQLIEECGLKGLKIGDAIVSRKHANFIINLGQAKAQDVIKLADVIKKTVKKIKGINLEPEVRIVR